MTLVFRLRFYTNYGQSLSICGNHAALGDEREENAVAMRYASDDFWEASIEIPAEGLRGEAIRYHYIWQLADGRKIVDSGAGRSLELAPGGEENLLIIDTWNDAGNFLNVFFTEPFRKVLLHARHSEIHPRQSGQPTHTFHVRAPFLQKGQSLCLLGEGDALGNWNTEWPILFERSENHDCMRVSVDLRAVEWPMAYKFGVYDVERNTFVRFEEGANRQLADGVEAGRHVLVDDGFARLPAEEWRGAGLAIPVFSLRSADGFGVGEFVDLIPLVDWAVEAGLRLIQILPVNDTSATGTWVDSYPYAAISAFALHPIYLNLARMTSTRNRSRLTELETERARLNGLETLDYEAVMRAKLDYVRAIFQAQRKSTIARADYKEFVKANEVWLQPYAAFCCFRDSFGTADFARWPSHHAYDADEIRKLMRKDAEVRAAVELNYFIQYHLHLQLKEATDYAHSRGVIVKGDIAIGVYRHGSDVWQDRDLYHTEMQAGAPPDPFAAKGQNWGFPTYNWPRMKQDGFRWWRQRFGQMGCYFDAFRIDHILGFFRIWSIPSHAVEGILGSFVPAKPVHREEFSRREIYFDRTRYAQPYITEAVVAEIFGAEAGEVRNQFLSEAAPGTYGLREEFATQRQVEKYFAGCETGSQEARWREGLYDLISNVILFEVPGSGGNEFHFRFSMESTASFRHLPREVQGKLRDLYVDYYFRRQDAMWMEEATQKLPALKSVTNMLICGEDLGLVPACVPEVMKQLGLLSLEIQRMPKELHREFSQPRNAPYLSVVTPGTHDMSSIRGWWEEDRVVTQRFYNHELGRAGDAPLVCTGELNEAVVAQHLASPAMWSVFQLQDLLGMDESLRRADVTAERINIPAIPNYYWRYRCHLSLEQLKGAGEFAARVRRLVAESGRLG